MPGQSVASMLVGEIERIVCGIDWDSTSTSLSRATSVFSRGNWSPLPQGIETIWFPKTTTDLERPRMSISVLGFSNARGVTLGILLRTSSSDKTMEFLFVTGFGLIDWSSELSSACTAAFLWHSAGVDNGCRGKLSSSRLDSSVVPPFPLCRREHIWGVEPLRSGDVGMASPGWDKESLKSHTMVRNFRNGREDEKDNLRRARFCTLSYSKRV